MTLTTQLIAALIASAFLAWQGSRIFGGVATVAAAVALLIHHGVIGLHIAGINLHLVLAIAIAAGGIGAWFQVSGKTLVTCATGVAVIGVLRTLTML